jgi:hypothetical protein
MNLIINFPSESHIWDALTAISTTVLAILTFATLIVTIIYSRSQVKTLEKQLNEEKKQIAHNCVLDFWNKLPADEVLITFNEIRKITEKFGQHIERIKHKISPLDYQPIIEIRDKAFNLKNSVLNRQRAEKEVREEKNDVTWNTYNKSIGKLHEDFQNLKDAISKFLKIQKVKNSP